MSGLLKNQNDKPYQVLGVWYPSELMAVKVEMWLGKTEPYAKGEYVIDLAEALKPDARAFNNPRIDWRMIKPNLAAEAGKPKAAAM